MSNRLADALRRKYRTPADALRALGLDPAILEGKMAHDRYRGGNRRLAYDAELDEQQRRGDLRNAISAALDEAELDPTEIVEIMLEHATPDEMAAIGQCCREVAADARGPSGWARDRAERRRLGKDMHLRRRVARDNPDPFAGMPEPGGSMSRGRDHTREHQLSGDARRARAHDMAMDRADPLAKLRSTLANQVGRM